MNGDIPFRLTALLTPYGAKTRSGRNFLPKRGRGVGVKRRIHADEGDLFAGCLRNEQAVERIAVVKRSVREDGSVLGLDWQNAKVVGGKLTLYAL